MDKKFSLEYQYQLYLKKCNISEEEMHPVQKKETKQAFFHACGQLLILMRDDVSELEEDKAVETMVDMTNQVSTYILDSLHNKN